jgi:hypothetical protein
LASTDTGRLEKGAWRRRNNGNDSWSRNTCSAQLAVLRREVSVVIAKKLPKFAGRVMFEPILDKAMYNLIVPFFRTVCKSATSKTAKIAIEKRIDMVKFVDYRVQFLGEWQFNESGNVKIEDV